MTMSLFYELLLKSTGDTQHRTKQPEQAHNRKKIITPNNLQEQHPEEEKDKTSKFESLAPTSRYNYHRTAAVHRMTG